MSASREAPLGQGLSALVRGRSDILSDQCEIREYRDKRNPKTVVIPECLINIFSGPLLG
jgi:hypothetical protein